ncbi:hypothetical protein ACFGVR_03115 [Mucilaginibacter sp. AW1-3]
MKTIQIILLFTLLQTVAYAQKLIGYGALMQQGEKVLFSFRLKNSDKITVLCTGKNDGYLVYRFGTKDQLELQYPALLNKASWKLFKYIGYWRGGGVKNDATEQHSITFSNNKASYQVFDNWYSEGNVKEAFIVVSINGKKSRVNGAASSGIGSIGLLRDKEALIHNYYWD